MATNQSRNLPFETIPGPQPRPGLAPWLALIGWIAIIASVAVPMVVLHIMGVGDSVDPFEPRLYGWYLVFAVILVVGFFGGVWLVALARRLRVRPADTVLAEASRPLVLFLRSFDDDDLIDPTPRIIPLGDFFPYRYEESLCAALEPVAPAVSIGRPGNKIAQLGGARFFVPDRAWRDAVGYLRRRAAVVVLVIGRTEGLWWEVETSMQQVPPERILFFFPFVEHAERRRNVWQRVFKFHPSRMPFSSRAFARMEAERQARYALFRERVQPFCSAPLPAALGTSQFVDFKSDGTPRALPRVRPRTWWVYGLTPSTARMVIDLPRTLKPFIDKLT